MGHIVPDYEFLLANGLDGVIAKLKSQTGADDAEKNYFSSSVSLTIIFYLSFSIFHYFYIYFFKWGRLLQWRECSNI